MKNIEEENKIPKLCSLETVFIRIILVSPSIKW